MSHDSQPGQPPAAGRRGVDDLMRKRAEQRRAKLRAELQRSRTGDHRVPTWVLTVVLVLMVAVVAYFIITS